MAGVQKIVTAIVFSRIQNDNKSAKDSKKE